ncbi:MarP family serine protease [Kineosporiaceae bacterium SCSIO 59966]|nr:MarP family serine protease [Kineosporiaceae bacterium SCSIO 59966]
MTGGTEPGVVLDVLLGLVLLGYAVSGVRQGAVVGVLSLAGFVGGAVVGTLVVPELLAGWQPGLGRTLVVLLGVLACAWVLQIAGVAVGRRLRGGLTWRPARVLDSLLGGVAAVVAVALVSWLLAGALRASPSPTLSRAIAGSTVLSTVDDLVPQDAGRLFADFRRIVEVEAFPRVFAGMDPEQILPVEEPDAEVADPVAAAAAGSIVKVTGVAEECARGQEGTGWVSAPQRVVTNAHVVAGVDSPLVQVTGTGPELPARVVAFDPERDLAVLAVPGLDAPPLPVGEDLARGDDAVVAGFPLDGPYQYSPARVRQVLEARGEDIYGTPGVVREVYSLYARVEPGNSGGPLLDERAAVVGVVFARSLDDASTGYALTLAESAPVLAAAPGLQDAVDTGPCAIG